MGRWARLDSRVTHVEIGATPQFQPVKTCIKNRLQVAVSVGF